MATNYEKPMTKVLIFGGKTGWIGQLMMKLVADAGKIYNRTN